MTLLIILGAVALIVLWAMSVQRKLVSAEELCKNAMSQIGVQQSSRWDALTALVELVKSYNEHEYNTLKDVISCRSKINGNSTAKEAQAQEEMLNGAMKQFNLVVEQYPELKANEMYTTTMNSVNTYENQVRLSRMSYNDCVTKYNRMIRQIPDSFVASLFHFETKDYLQEEAGKTSMPSMKI